MTPAEIDLALDRAQLEELRYLIGDERNVAAGRAVATPSYGQLAKTAADLQPFKTALEFTSSNYDGTNTGSGPDGIIVLPADFAYANSIVLSGTGRRVKIVNESELSYILESPIMAPTITRPIAVLGNVGGTVNSIAVSTQKIQLFPETGMSGTLYYFRRPATPNYVETVSGRTRTYDSGASTQMEWGDVAITRIVERALKILSTHLKDGDTLTVNTQKNVH